MRISKRNENLDSFSQLLFALAGKEAELHWLSIFNKQRLSRRHFDDNFILITFSRVVRSKKQRSKIRTENRKKNSHDDK
jgi:hypothetical protein